MRDTNDTPSPVRKMHAALAGFAVGAALAVGGCSSKTDYSKVAAEKAYLAVENRRVMDALEAKNVEAHAAEVALQRAVHEHLATVAGLEERNRESGLRTASLEKATVELRRALREKETLVGELERRTRELTATVKAQAASLKEKDAAIRDGEVRLARLTQETSNTAR